MRRLLLFTVSAGLAASVGVSVTHLSQRGAALLSLPSLEAATACENLKSIALPDTTITLAESVAAGAFTPPPPANGRGGRGPAVNPYADAPAFCRITATLKPSADSDIK